MVNAKPGDAFYVPAGKVHAIMSGILIAEIQQNSNTTYRIYDWGRVDKDGKGRILNASKALDVIDFNSLNQSESYSQNVNKNDYRTDVILRSDFFNIDKIKVYHKYIGLTKSSFIIMMCTQGSGEMFYEGGTCNISFGETILLPACIGKFRIFGDMTLLSTFML
jgi:mannose-6-phosphate isomerase